MIKVVVNITKLLLVLPIRLAFYVLKVVFMLPLITIKSLGGGK